MMPCVLLFVDCDVSLFILTAGPQLSNVRQPAHEAQLMADIVVDNETLTLTRSL